MSRISFEACVARKGTSVGGTDNCKGSLKPYDSGDDREEVVLWEG